MFAKKNPLKEKTLNNKKNQIGYKSYDPRNLTQTDCVDQARETQKNWVYP